MWLDVLVDKWNALPEEERVPLHRYLNMTSMQADIWLSSPPDYVSGSDESGWGSIAGPLVVCAVCAPYRWSIPGLGDSKKLRESVREELYWALYKEERQGNIRIYVIDAEPSRIDKLGAKTVLRVAHCRALEAAAQGLRSVMMVADGKLDLPGGYNISLPGADSFVPQVMAASIIAKQVCDAYMKDAAALYPNYGFEQNVGYGTPEHYKAIATFGSCPLHRQSYNLHTEEGVSDEAGDGEECGSVPQTSGELAQRQRGASILDGDLHISRGECSTAEVPCGTATGSGEVAQRQPDAPVTRRHVRGNRKKPVKLRRKAGR